MKSRINIIRMAIICGLMLVCGRVQAQEIGSAALEDYFKKACMISRQGLEKNDPYDLTDALVYMSKLEFVCDSLILPKHPAEKVFSVENISRLFEEERNVISLAQDAELVRGDNDMTLYLTHELIPAKKSVTYENVSLGRSMMYMMVISGRQTPVKVTVKSSDKKKCVLVYEDKKSIAKGQFAGVGASYTITVENLSKNDEIIAIAIQ